MTDNVTTKDHTPEDNPAQESCTPAKSYVNAFKSDGAIPKTTRESRTPVRNQTPGITNQVHTQSPRLNDQLQRIITYHNSGSRTLVIIRGVPGSGKTTLARQIIDLTVGGSPINYKAHIFSSDDYFSRNGNYVYDVSRIDDAHKWNHKHVRLSVGSGLSPVIVDNTNTELWEMKPYIHGGVENGYFVEVMEPLTPWARNCQQLVKKNTHGVPYAKIHRMLDRYEPHHSFEYLLKMFNIRYPPDKMPPFLRLTPPFQKNNARENTKELSKDNCTIAVTQNDPPTSYLNSTVIATTNKLEHSCSIVEQSKKNTSAQEAINNDDEAKEEQRRQKLLEYTRHFEEFEKLERAWESGAEWVERNKIDEAGKSPTKPEGPKPQRDPKSREHSRSRSESLLQLADTAENLHVTTDWQIISNSVPAWDHDASPKVEEPTSVVHTTSSATSVETGDNDIRNPNGQVLTTRPRDINFDYVPPTTAKIPHKRMLDKGSTTNDEINTDLYRCKNEHKHFIAFRKMFKQIAEVDLKDIFEKCCGDVHWASEIVLDGVKNNEIAQFVSEEENEVADENVPDCNCISTYSIVPRTSEPKSPSVAVTQLTALESKKKKSKVLSESSIQLKRQIEKGVNISEHHYSNHSLKLRKLRRGEVSEGLPNMPLSSEAYSQPSTSTTPDTPAPLELVTLSDDDSSDCEELEETVNVTLGADLIMQLNDRFNNTEEIKFAEHIVPVVSMPIALLNQLNALWLESLAHQMETQGKFSAVLLKEDEDFARQLAEKEAEYEQAGEEPEVPDFKEIMDMDLALTLYNKDVSEWRNNEPTDMASKLSRDKLHNLFPEYDKDILSEILLAHENNFQATVEVLLMSTGKAEVLEETNGLNKFVMNKEIERQAKALDEEKQKALSEEEWPVLGGADGPEVEIETVNGFRKQAQQHLDRRNFNYNKAQDYFRRGMTQVASYYASLADFHKTKFEQANHYAASSLIQVNAASQNSTTLDLHYLFVTEALQALDLFLDHHIGVLADGGGGRRELYLITGRGLHSRGGPRIRPAVRRRLQQRGLRCDHVNPGLLKVMVVSVDKLTHQIE